MCSCRRYLNQQNQYIGNYSGQFYRIGCNRIYFRAFLVYFSVLFTIESTMDCLWGEEEECRLKGDTSTILKTSHFFRWIDG